MNCSCRITSQIESVLFDTNRNIISSIVSALPPPSYLLATQLLPPAVRALYTRWDTRPPAVQYSALTHV